MNEQDQILLDAYFNGLLSESEAAALQERAGSDPEFAAAFRLRRDMEQWLQREPDRQAVSETLTSVRKDFFRETVQETPMKASRVNWKRALLLAASFALVLFATWYFNSVTPPAYEQYAQHTPVSFTQRSDTQTLQSAAEVDFNSQQYDRALASLDALLRQDPGNLTATLYKGICLIELDRTAEARTALEPLAAGSSALRSDAQWYVGLSYLKEKNVEQCKAELLRIEAGSDRYAQAQELLSDL